MNDEQKPDHAFARSRSNAGLGDDLFWFIDAHNDDELPDGAWWSVLENAVTYWNEKHGTNFDLNDTVHLYLQRKEIDA